MSKTRNNFAPEVRERAVRKVLDHERDQTHNFFGFFRRWLPLDGIKDGGWRSGTHRIGQQAVELFQLTREDMARFRNATCTHGHQHLSFPEGSTSTPWHTSPKDEMLAAPIEVTMPLHPLQGFLPFL